MPAYILLTREKTRNEQELHTYDGLAPATFAGHHVQLLVKHDRFCILEGTAPEDIVLAEFPDAASASAWYESPAYQSVVQHRLQGGDFRCVLIDGNCSWR